MKTSFLSGSGGEDVQHKRLFDVHAQITGDVSPGREAPELGRDFARGQLRQLHDAAAQSVHGQLHGGKLVSLQRRQTSRAEH